MSKNPVVHFEMPYEDSERLSKFYSQAFGWELNTLGEDMGNYVTAATAETDENRMVKTPGTINGGFFKKVPEYPDMYPSVVISVSDVEEAIVKVKEAGGQILNKPENIPGVGIFVSIRDTEGNRVSLLQPNEL
ncbi:MAG: VOC family protein [bacterium]